MPAFVAHKPKTPVLLYDGNCGFCTRTARRIEHDAPLAVTIMPYQESGELFPELQPEEMGKALHLVDTDGAVYIGAEAIYRAGQAAEYPGWPLRWYRKQGVFKRISDAGYAFVANYRYPISTLCRWTHGNDFLPHSYELGRILFGRFTGVLAVFMIFSLAFLPGGMADTLNLFAAVGAAGNGGAHALSFTWPAFWIWAGLISAALMIKGVLPLATSLLALVSWMQINTHIPESLRLVQDAVLTEMLLAAVFLSSIIFIERRWSLPWGGKIGRWLVLWLIVRISWGNLAAQLGTYGMDGQRQWLSGEGVSRFLLNQPAPGMLAGEIALLPGGVLMILLLAFGLLMPLATVGPRKIRRVLAVCWMLFHLLLLFVGNYGLYPYMAIVMGLLLLDDQLLGAGPPKRRTADGTLYQLGKGVGGAILALFIVVGTIQLGVTLKGNSAEEPTRFAQNPAFIEPVVETFQQYGLLHLPILARQTPEEWPYVEMVAEGEQMPLPGLFRLVTPVREFRSHWFKDLRVEQLIYMETLIGLDLDKARLYGALISQDVPHEELQEVTLSDQYGNKHTVDLLAWYNYLKDYEAKRAEEKDHHHHH